MYKKNSLSIFRGTYGQMYAVVWLVWENYSARQKDFAKKNTKYTAELADQQHRAIDDARKLPDVSVRRDFVKEARNTLGNAALNCTDNWQSISSLIENSYPKNEWDIKKGQAGAANYSAATHEQWDKVIDLTSAAVQFLADNMAALTAGGMLPDFPKDTAGYKDVYDNLFNGFYSAKQAFETQTTAKATASNAIYTTAMAMMTDAKQMYKKDARTREEFVYESLMKKIRGKGFSKTGMDLILRGDDKTPLLTPASVVYSNGQSGKASAKGIIRCELPEGTYNFTLTADKYNTITGTVKIVAGTMHQKTITLQKAAAAGSINQ